MNQNEMRAMMTNHEVYEISTISEPSVMAVMIAVTTEPSSFFDSLCSILIFKGLYE